MKYDVVAVADIFADIVITGKEKPEFSQVEKLSDDYEIELGGSAPIFASQFAKLGGKVALITVLGNDLLGSFLTNRMQEIGIDTRFITKSNTLKTPMGLNISVQGDRAMLTVLGSLGEVSSELITDDILNQTRHWHIAGYFLLNQLIDFWPGFLKDLKNRGITVSLDTNWAPGGNWKQIIDLLSWVEVFLPNENEAMAITGQSDYHKAGIELSRITKTIVIKRGSEGASVFLEGKEIAQPVPEKIKAKLKVVDSTGTGDSFDGGFIFEWLQNAPIEKCLETAILCGTSCVQCVGGINGQFVR